jgi:hypothetical protein
MNRAKRYHEIPGTRSGHFDPQMQYLRTERYDWFQDALSRIAPELELAWDRELGRWCLIREDPVLCPLRHVTSEGAGFIFSQKVYTYVQDICWFVEGRDGASNQKHYREPDVAILNRVASEQREAYAFRNELWAEEAMQREHDRREAEFDKEFDEEYDGLFEEAAFHLDGSSSTPTRKIRGAVPANYRD